MTRWPREVPGAQAGVSGETGMISASIGALLDGVVDYAGLFAPAALSMTDAVAAYDEHLRAAESWALGRFVLPATRLEEFVAKATSQKSAGPPWRLAVLAGAGDLETVQRFNAEHPEVACVDTIEARAQSVAEVNALSSAASRMPSGNARLTFYIEVALMPDPDPLIAAIGAAGMRAKLRTGGVTADAFPTASQVARFIRGCASHDVPFKATAGLHHVVRGEYRLTYDPASPSGAMFGFLNLVCAAIFARTGLDDSALVELLEERDVHAFTFADDAVAWRGRRASVAEVRTGRARSATSFGSCSFAEPMRELVDAGLL